LLQKERAQLFEPEQGRARGVIRGLGVDFEVLAFCEPPIVVCLRLRTGKE